VRASDLLATIPDIQRGAAAGVIGTRHGNDPSDHPKPRPGALGRVPPHRCQGKPGRAAYGDQSLQLLEIYCLGFRERCVCFER
jgi:hypothetical protein